ncbi:Gfo/Idh/MocA family oxidoreductase [Mesobacillus foraminis]|uniref:Gfo/Idh/MocA family protein n=1 Tax=Mesobacillus foraminis TaxID=279826 RepID=UPI001BE9D408|nr:Gfo/Idh/MocA family oxidoreductase [Mesobacillus foraminis]MBT2756345.1 Gfo/Idh/MocA family oxidoreductase [Mesobacillus foraminis]
MKAGVIGTGSMGENHVRTYISLADHCELVGIFDKNEKRAQEIADKYQIKAFSTLDELLEEVDLVSVVVPTEFHYEVGLACIRHNVHMLMEKPIASTVSEAESLIEKAAERGVKIQVGHIELYNPIISILKKAIDNENVIAVEAQRMNPFDPRLAKVDVVQDLMIHDLYILSELLNENIRDLYALGKEIDGSQKHTMVLLRFQNGTLGQVAASFKSEEKIRMVRVITEKALYKADLLKMKIEITRPVHYYMKQEIGHMNQKVTECIHIPPVEPLKLELMDFMDSVKNNTEPSITGEDGIRALTLCTEINRFIKNLPK